MVLVSRKRFADLRSACEVAAIRLDQLAPQIAAVLADPFVMRAGLDLRLDCGRPPGWRHDNQPEVSQHLKIAAARCSVEVSVTGARFEWIAHWLPG